MTHEELYEKYPHLFARRALPMSESCLHWGITCGEGWNALIDAMSAELQQAHPEVQYEQIKEKFGVMRVYLYGTTKESFDVAYSIVHKFEDISATTCETCGSPDAEIVSNAGWLSATCGKH